MFLYELYDSTEAFDVHLASPHFRAFNEETADLVAEKSVQSYREVCQ